MKQVNRKQALNIAIKNIIKCDSAVHDKLDTSDDNELDGFNVKLAIRADDTFVAVKKSKAKTFSVSYNSLYGVYGLDIEALD